MITAVIREDCIVLKSRAVFRLLAAPLLSVAVCCSGPAAVAERVVSARDAVYPIAAVGRDGGMWVSFGDEHMVWLGLSTWYPEANREMVMIGQMPRRPGVQISEFFRPFCDASSLLASYGLDEGPLLGALGSFSGSRFPASLLLVGEGYSVYAALATDGVTCLIPRLSMRIFSVGWDGASVVLTVNPHFDDVSVWLSAEAGVGSPNLMISCLLEGENIAGMEGGWLPDLHSGLPVQFGNSGCETAVRGDYQGVDAAARDEFGRFIGWNNPRTLQPWSRWLRISDRVMFYFEFANVYGGEQACSGIPGCVPPLRTYTFVVENNEFGLITRIVQLRPDEALGVPDSSLAVETVWQSVGSLRELPRAIEEILDESPAGDQPAIVPW